MPSMRPQGERRDTSPFGVLNRVEIDGSLRKLRDLGLSTRAVEYFRRRARETGRPPFVLMLETIEEKAQSVVGTQTLMARDWRYR